MFDGDNLELFPELDSRSHDDFTNKYTFSFIDLFAGIGGFHVALQNLGGHCVFASEKDEYARQTYLENFKLAVHQFNADIRNVSADEIPDHDILCAGFPCQPFSQAGNKKGFQDGENSERGNLFYCILDILEAKLPKAFILENVRHLIAHDEGKTFEIILKSLKQANYEVSYKVLKASDFNVPQHRPRVYLVGFLKDKVNVARAFNFPKPLPLKKTMSDIFKASCDKKIGFTIRVGGKGSKIDDRRNWEFYRVEGETRRIDLDEAREMMAFPENFKFPTSKTQSMKQLGNSVCVEVVKHVGQSVLEYLAKNTKEIEDDNMQNKGEISEAYVLFKIIHDKMLAWGDAHGFASTDFMRVVKIKNGTSNIKINDISIEIHDDLGSYKTIRTENIITQTHLSEILKHIKAQTGTFNFSPLEEVKILVGLLKNKGTSFEKSDIVVDFQDDILNQNQGMSIKSFLGNDPTLLNASSATNFIYEVMSLDHSKIDAINSINSNAKIKDRLAQITNSGAKLTFSHCENTVYESNLRKCDSLMPEILADALLSFFMKKSNKMLHLYEASSHFQSNSVHFRLKDFVKYTILGIFSTKVWNGQISANGSIIVKEGGELVSYHTNRDDILKDYFYKQCYFDMPSSTRHRFGLLYKENGKLYFKLNLQLRLLNCRIKKS